MVKITHFVCQTSDGYWGRADSERAALLIAKDEGSNMRAYVVFRIMQQADKRAPFVDAHGGLWHHADSPDDVQTTVVTKKNTKK